ncbi:hypothetical protein CPB85DRAFT_244829 [Mucidula mucida]|nr:hypothetical protein CPB85DRAFT_244829 [Mucidula mucida]
MARRQLSGPCRYTLAVSQRRFHYSGFYLIDSLCAAAQCACYGKEQTENEVCIHGFRIYVARSVDILCLISAPSEQSKRRCPEKATDGHHRKEGRSKEGKKTSLKCIPVLINIAFVKGMHESNCVGFTLRVRIFTIIIMFIFQRARCSLGIYALIKRAVWCR